jgi:hypothetical protein
MRASLPRGVERVARVRLPGRRHFFTNGVAGSHTRLEYSTHESVKTRVGLDFFTSEIVQTCATATRKRHTPKTNFLPVGNLIRNSSLFFLPVGNSIRINLTIQQRVL